jgi:predicted ester cyclase
VSAETNKEIVRKIEEAWDANAVDVLDQYFAPTFRSHSGVPMLPPGLAGAKIAHAASFESFPDRKMTIEGIYAEGDRVAVRTRMRGTNQGGFPAMRVPPNGNAVDIMSISIYRLEDGKVVEHWGQNDVLTLMAQLGVAPPGGPQSG